ncbi:MAG: hypothetical protein HYZ50_00480 [Deltaproteobacteria bacterium]|nr:hypothetical protein [Deltaproteobacteria bacterium]
MDDAFDIIVDVIVDGHVVGPQEIPPAVAVAIDAALAKHEEPAEIQYGGIGYSWLVRPCVYP